MSEIKTKRTRTMSRSQLDEKLAVARLCPGVAHLPSFGLMAPAGWNYHEPELEKRALKILAGEGIVGVRIKETAPALFWYWDAKGELQLHDWEGASNENS